MRFWISSSFHWSWSLGQLRKCVNVLAAMLQCGHCWLVVSFERLGCARTGSQWWIGCCIVFFRYLVIVVAHCLEFPSLCGRLWCHSMRILSLSIHGSSGWYMRFAGFASCCMLPGDCLSLSLPEVFVAGGIVVVIGFVYMMGWLS